MFFQEDKTSNSPSHKYVLFYNFFQTQLFNN
jgi:hypothetical protein